MKWVTTDGNLPKKLIYNVIKVSGLNNTKHSINTNPTVDMHGWTPTGSLPLEARETVNFEGGVL